MRLPRILLCISFSVLTGAQLSAQTAPSADTSVLSAAIKSSMQQYQRFISLAAPLYSGPQYVEYDSRINEGHPFLLSASFQKGTIVYENILYENVLLKYDLLMNKFVLNDASGTFKLSPDYEKISSFTLGDHFFVKLDRDSNNVLLSGSQFYEILFTGNTVTLLKKESKKVEEDLTSVRGLKRTVLSSTDLYVKKGNAYYAFNKKRTALNVFKEKKTEIRQFIRQQNLKFGDDRETSLLKIAVYYDSLKK